MAFFMRLMQFAGYGILVLLAIAILFGVCYGVFYIGRRMLYWFWQRWGEEIRAMLPKRRRRKRK